MPNSLPPNEFHRAITFSMDIGQVVAISGRGVHGCRLLAGVRRGALERQGLWSKSAAAMLARRVRRARTLPMRRPSPGSCQFAEGIRSARSAARSASIRATSASPCSCGKGRVRPSHGSAIATCPRQDSLSRYRIGVGAESGLDARPGWVGRTACKSAYAGRVPTSASRSAKRRADPWSALLFPALPKARSKLTVGRLYNGCAPGWRNW